MGSKMRSKKHRFGSVFNRRKLSAGLVIVGIAVFGAYYFITSQALTPPQNPNDWAAYSKVQVPGQHFGIDISHTNSHDGALNQYKQAQGSGTTLTVSMNGSWDLRTDNGPWQVLVRLDYDPEYLRAKTVSCTGAFTCYNSSVTDGDIKAALNAQTPPLLDPNRTGAHSSGVTACFDAPKVGSLGAHARLYEVSLTYIKNWPGINNSNTHAVTNPTEPVGTMFGIARGSCKTNTNASGAGWQLFDTTTCGNTIYHYETGAPWKTKLECNYGPDPGGAAFVGFGERAASTGGAGAGTGSTGSGSGGSTGKSASSSGGSSTPANKPGSTPESSSQGTQTSQQKPESSPFYDGKQYASGSDPDNESSGPLAVLSSKKIVKWWPVLAVAVAVIAPAAYLYLRHHPKLLQKSPLSRILKNR